MRPRFYSILHFLAALAWLGLVGSVPLVAQPPSIPAPALPQLPTNPEFSEPHELKAPEEVEFPRFPWALVLAGGAAVLILGLAILFLVKKGKRAPGTPHSQIDLALRRLKELDERAGEQDSYHFSIAVDDVLRDYLSRALGLRAEHQTSQEFLHSLDSRGGLPERLLPVIREFLETSDEFKFARRPGGEEANKRLIAEAVEVIGGSRR